MGTHNRSENGRGAWVALCAHYIHILFLKLKVAPILISLSCYSWTLQHIIIIIIIIIIITSPSVPLLLSGT
jgi:hypothetical protein